MTAPWPYPAPHDDGAADHLTAGLRVPAIALTATRGPAVDLSATSGRVVVFVYPWTGRPGLANPPDWDDIPGAHGSTPQAEGFRDCHDRFQTLGVTVLGLSTQARDHQRELSERLALPFPILSDDRLLLTRALRLPTFETGGVPYLRRLTLVLRDGCIEHVLYPIHPPPQNALAVLAWLERQPAA